MQYLHHALCVQSAGPHSLGGVDEQCLVGACEQLDQWSHSSSLFYDGSDVSVFRGTLSQRAYHIHQHLS